MKIRPHQLLAGIALWCAFFALPVYQSGCAAPSTRVAQVQTLKSVGQAAEAAVSLSAQLYRDGKITAAQARQVMTLYDQKFQPAFRLAVSAAQANLDSIASDDVTALASQLSALVLNLQTHTP